MKLRSATPSDAARVASLSTQLGYPESIVVVRERLASLGARDDHTVLVVEDGGRVVGWVHAFVAERIESDAFAEIGGLVVEEQLQGRGIGAMLLAGAEAWAGLNGLQTVRIRSNVVREDAHRFYVQRGYALSKRQAVFTRTIGRTR